MSNSGDNPKYGNSGDPKYGSQNTSGTGQGWWKPSYYDQFGNWHPPEWVWADPYILCPPYYPTYPSISLTIDSDSNFAALSVKKLREDAQLPTYGSDQAAGLDLYAAEEKVLSAGHTTLVPTGIAIELPVGTVGLMRTRSSMFKKGLHVDGTVDSDYRGEIFVMVFNHNKYDRLVAKGERVGQMVIAPFRKALIFEVKELSETTRGTGGFGSTGK